MYVEAHLVGRAIKNITLKLMLVRCHFYVIYVKRHSEIEVV